MCASCWFFLHVYITMHGSEKVKISLVIIKPEDGIKRKFETSYLSYNITSRHNPKDLKLHGLCTIFFVTRLTDLFIFLVLLQ
jgi:hypothetical protein